VPKLWSETINAHRREVRDAIFDTTAALVSERGLLSVTMSEVAERTGIGRATLYKYFPDVETILLAWHEREISSHLEYLSKVRDEAPDPRSRLKGVLEAYALLDYEHHGTKHHRSHLQDPGLTALLHRGGHVDRAQQQLRAMIAGLLVEAVNTGDVRSDVTPDELARFCLNALAGACGLRSKAAVQRLVSLVIAGLRPSA
jgi:AcrR family transcriptional regulator